MVFVQDRHKQGWLSSALNDDNLLNPKLFPQSLLFKDEKCVCWKTWKDDIKQTQTEQPSKSQSKITSLLDPLLSEIITIDEKAKKRFETRITSFWKKTKQSTSQPISIIQLLQHFNLKDIPTYVNQLLIQWHLCGVPLELLFHIPTSLEVWQMQCVGRRCVTVFVEKHELNNSIKDPYPPFETRDVLSFLMHDLQHMEKFVDLKFYSEQVGFSAHLMSANKTLLKLYDKSFQYDLEHVTADMNCCVIHLFGFLKSKLKIAEWRKQANVESGENGFELLGEADLKWQSMMFEPLLALDLGWAQRKPLIESANKMCSTQFLEQDAFLLRQFWHDLGNQILGTNIPLFLKNDEKDGKVFLDPVEKVDGEKQLKEGKEEINV